MPTNRLTKEQIKAGAARFAFYRNKGLIMKLLGPNDLIWRYIWLCRNGSHRALIRIERDSKYPDMWRVVRPDGSLTDIVEYDARQGCRDELGTPGAQRSRGCQNSG
jgi:hypothetical protein